MVIVKVGVLVTVKVIVKVGVFHIAKVVKSFYTCKNFIKYFSNNFKKTFHFKIILNERTRAIERAWS